jgi:potassium-transporting ATPase potassium-binding subunit
MSYYGWMQIAIFSLLLLACAKPVGIYLLTVLQSEQTWLDRVFGPLERICYRLSGVDPHLEMNWTTYAYAVLSFSGASCIFSYIILRLQGYLPFNPMGFSTTGAPSYATAMSPDLAFNTAVSFTSNTNWQAYSGEAAMSYLSQMLSLAFHNWVSAAVGIAVAAALIRGFARHNTEGIGNFWRDLIRGTLYVLFPICFFYSIFLISQGVIQNFSPYVVANTVEGVKQILPMGPVASQEAIKMLGTNGGGFFNANSAHPFENPTPLTNLIEMLSIFLIPAGLTFTFGSMVKDGRQGIVLLITMYLFFLAGVFIVYQSEGLPSPNFAKYGIDTSTANLHDLGGNMEGKEARFGLANSALFAVITTDASCGAVNCMHDSLTPLGGLIPMLNMQLGEIIFGGVGAGLYGMLVFAILTVFIAGLMVGRTPEYLGKKIEKKEVKMAMLFVLTSAASILVFTAISSVLKFEPNTYWNQPGAVFNNLSNGQAHGFSELLYAFSSATANNGSAFAGLAANTPYYNLTTGLAMLFGRFLMIVPVLAIAGSLASKKNIPPTSGTFPTHGLMFIVLLSSVILIVGALTYFPALILGPILDHMLMIQGRVN